MGYYKLFKSLEKFRALETEEIVKTGFGGEVFIEGVDQFRNGDFRANIYTNGDLHDIEINGWKFSFHIKGYYHLPGSFVITTFPIEAVDPNGTDITFYNTPLQSLFSEDAMLCSYLDLIHIYSHFEDAATARKFYHLLRSLKGEWSKRGDGDDDITKEQCMTHAEFFKEYYLKHIDDCSDKCFMRLIKETVNGAIDIIIKDIEKNKIQD